MLSLCPIATSNCLVILFFIILTYYTSPYDHLVIMKYYFKLYVLSKNSDEANRCGCVKKGSYQSFPIFPLQFINCAQQKYFKKMISIFFPMFPCILPNRQHIALLMSFMNLYELRFRNMLCFISHHFKCNANTATHE